MSLKNGESGKDIKTVELTATHARTTDAYPSSAAFDLIADGLKDDAERKDAIKKGGAIFGFTIKNAEGSTESWYIDLKETGTVGKGTAPEGKKAAGTLQFSVNE